ncbi:MAG: hypothetical protein ABJF10_17985 [Chthoniobacter sp.]|uniref:hypothetical protein n=1 Tax=Chthoniobacter sp. TaxID=2510640 RepID=UPI0032A5772D
MKALNRPFSLLFGFLLGACSVTAYGWLAGYVHSSQPYQPVEEAKICYAALRYAPDRLTPQLREYLKGRLYWNAAYWIQPSWLVGWHIDFGPVDESLLDNVPWAKDASPGDEVYHAAMLRHPHAATKP